MGKVQRVAIIGQIVIEQIVGGRCLRRARRDSAVTFMCTSCRTVALTVSVIVSTLRHGGLCEVNYSCAFSRLFSLSHTVGLRVAMGGLHV